MRRRGWPRCGAAQGEQESASVLASSEPAGSTDTASQSTTGPGEALEYNKAFYVLDSLNAGLSSLDREPELQAPQSTWENFVSSCEAGDYDRAARSLNLNGIPTAKQAELGPRYARMLKSVLDRKAYISWGSLSDRPDGTDDGFNLKKAQSGSTSSDGPRREVELTRLSLDGRDVEIWLQRVKTSESAPVWVFARQTVDNVPLLYREFGPSPLEERMPTFLREHGVGQLALWQVIGLFVTLGLGYLIGWGIQIIAERVLRDAPSYWTTTLARCVRRPVAITLGLVFFYLIAVNTLRLAGPVLMVLEPLVIVLIVLGVAWTLSRVIGCASELFSRRYTTDEANSEAQSVLTRIKVAKHVLTALVMAVGLGIALSQFEWFRALGTALLTSAAVGAAILGLAAQRSLGNIFAGIQLAITQPVRVGDAVIFEEEFGWIEEIAITYIVIRTWDLRRLVIPTAYFLDKPVQNWTMNGENMMKPVYLYADYRVDVDAVRKEFETILNDQDDWDHEVPPILQVTSWTKDSVELRALCSAKDPSTAWTLHCDVRERLLAYLRDLEGGRYLPRERILLDGRRRQGSASNGNGQDRDRDARKTRKRSGSRSNRSRKGAGGKARSKAEVTHDAPEDADGD